MTVCPTLSMMASATTTEMPKNIFRVSDARRAACSASPQQQYHQTLLTVPSPLHRTTKFAINNRLPSAVSPRRKPLCSTSINEFEFSPERIRTPTCATSKNFRPDLSLEDQLKRVSLHRNKRLEIIRAQGRFGATMDWYDTVSGYKRRLKMMITEAAVQEQRRSSSPATAASLSSSKAQLIPAATSTKIPVGHICRDIDMFFQDHHVRMVGSPGKAFLNVRQQLLQMDLYRPQGIEALSQNPNHQN